ncbi:glutamate racemase [Bacteroidota bacterium]
MNLSPEQPIGLFDSGVGGLTVASAIKRILPNENIIYFGDIAHLPYGDKSAESVKYYSTRISSFLLEQNCKVILVACNTASAQAYNDVQKLVGEKAIVMNVIDPVVEYLITHAKKGKVGIIGTKGTISSGVYEEKIKEKNKNLEVSSIPTPLFVPMIEEGFIFDNISNAIIKSYLSRPELNNIATLILGCTHYPIIKNQISKYYDFKVDIIDSAQTAAARLRVLLENKSLLNNNPEPDNKFFVSDYTPSFEVISKMFFEEKINLKKLDLWKEK